MESKYFWIIIVILIITAIFKFGKTQTPVSNATEEDIENALKDGNKILAIKYYRTINKCGLSEAKQAVEAMAEKL